MCVCTNSFQSGFPKIDLSVFSAPFIGIFDVSQCTYSQNQCLVPFPLLVPLALLSICVPPSYQDLPRFGWNQQTLTEHCWTRQAPSEHQLRMSGCLLCLFGWMCSFSVKNRLKKNRLYRLPYTEGYTRSSAPAAIFVEREREREREKEREIERRGRDRQTDRHTGRQAG